MKKLFVALLLLLTASISNAGWLDTSYVKRIKLLADNTKIDADLTAFPLTAFLNSSRINFSQCDAAGLSVRITSSNGVSLCNYERDGHDYANSKGVYHFKGNPLDASDTPFYLYYKPEYARWEQFLDTVHIDSQSGLTMSINRPTKYASNPILGSSTYTWDEDMNYVHVLTSLAWPSESRYRMWYASFSEDTPMHYYSCYAYSSDGLTWTRPNLGQVTYGGNTNNNILAPYNIDQKWDVISSAFYDESTGTYYFMVGAKNDGADAKVSDNTIITSTSPTGPFTTRKELTIDATHTHGMGIIRRNDGRFIANYQQWDGSKRSIGTFLSDTTNVDGDYTDYGITQLASGTGDQMHSNGYHKHGGQFYDFTVRLATETYYDKIILSSTRNGTYINTLDASWISAGASGAWDDVYLIDGENLLHIGDEWWYYYTGMANTTAPYAGRIGLAKIGYMRIGQIAKTSAGEGYIITKPINVGSTGLYINAIADGASDKIEVELLDASNDSVITNYAKADCTDFTGDSYSSEIVWGSNHFFDSPIKWVKIKFYLNKSTSDVKLHAYMIGESDDCLEDGSTSINRSIAPINRTVFDTSYNLVSHLSDITTSTVDGGGTKTGANAPQVASGNIYQKQVFDGSDDHIVYPDVPTGDLTLEYVVNFTGLNTTNLTDLIIDYYGGDTTNRSWLWRVNASNEMNFFTHTGVTQTVRTSTNASLTTGTDYHLAVVYDRANNTATFYKNCVALSDDGASLSSKSKDVVHTISIGSRYNGSDWTTSPLNGTADEARISTTKRSTAWIKASCYTLLDTLFTYTTETHLPRHGFINFQNPGIN